MRHRRGTVGCPSLVQFTNVFVPFGLLLATALLLPEVTDDVTLHRIIYTIWLSNAFLIVALCLAALPRYSMSQPSYMLLTGTFAYVAYMVHFYYAGIVEFGGIRGIFAHMRPFVATTNILLTFWWTIDTLISWFAD